METKIRISTRNIKTDDFGIPFFDFAIFVIDDPVIIKYFPFPHVTMYPDHPQFVGTVIKDNALREIALKFLTKPKLSPKQR